MLFVEFVLVRWLLLIPRHIKLVSEHLFGTYGRKKVEELKSKME